MGPTTEASWNDLYNGVTDLLGPERAETLMSHPFRYDPSQLAMKTDIVAMKTDIVAVKLDIAGLESRIARVESAIDGLRTDISGLYRTAIGGFAVLLAAMIGILFRIG